MMLIHIFPAVLMIRNLVVIHLYMWYLDVS